MYWYYTWDVARHSLHVVSPIPNTYLSRFDVSIRIHIGVHSTAYIFACMLTHIHIAYVRAALRLLVVVGSYGLPQTKVANRTVRTRVINCMPKVPRIRSVIYYAALKAKFAPQCAATGRWTHCDESGHTAPHAALAPRRQQGDRLTSSRYVSACALYLMYETMYYAF